MTAPVPLGAPVICSAGSLDAIDFSTGYPSGLQVGDTLVAAAYVDAGNTKTISDYGGNGSNNLVLIANTATGLRRGVAVYAKSVNYLEIRAGGSASGPISMVTSGGAGIISGAVMAFRGGLNVEDTTSAIATLVEGAGTAGITAGTAPAPASLTTTATDRLALAIVGWNNTGTISDIHANGWNDGYGAVNDGVCSLSFQYVVVPAGATLSGGTAVLGSSGAWGVITCALIPRYPSGTDIYVPTP